MSPSLPRRRLLTLTLLALLTTICPILPFHTILSDESIFTPSQIRLIFLLALVLSWPSNITSLILSLLTYFLHMRAFPDTRRLLPAHDSRILLAALSATSLAVGGVACLVVAQGVWVFVAQRAAVVWLLALVVLGLAFLIIVQVTVIALCVQAATLYAAAHRDPKLVDTDGGDIVLHIPPDETSPHRIVAKISRQGSDLVF